MYIDRIWPFATFLSRNKHKKNIRLMLYWLRLRVAEAEVQTSHPKNSTKQWEVQHRSIISQREEHQPQREGGPLTYYFVIFFVENCGGYSNYSSHTIPTKVLHEKVTFFGVGMGPVKFRLRSTIAKVHTIFLLFFYLFTLLRVVYLNVTHEELNTKITQNRMCLMYFVTTLNQLKPVLTRSFLFSTCALSKIGLRF